MTKTSLPLDAEQRTALIAHIARQLYALDDRALLHLAEAVREPAGAREAIVEGIEQSLSRRRFMVALLGSGVLATTASAVTAWQWGTSRSQTLSGELKTLNDELKAREAELSRLWGLVDLYEQLEAVPLEQSALDGLADAGLSLSLAVSAAGLISQGDQSVRDVLGQVDWRLGQARDSLAWLEGVLANLSSQLHLLEEAIGHALKQANPISQALSAYFETLIRLLPLEMGQRSREILGRIDQFIAGLPDIIQSINLDLLVSLREEWFADEADKGMRGWLIRPLNVYLLEPIKALTERMTALNAQWDKKLAGPVRQAIEQRAALRRQIADYQAQLPHR